MDPKQAEQLLKKYLDGTCSPEEKLWVEQWYNDITGKEEPMPPVQNWAELEQRLTSSLPQPAKTRRLWPRIAAAASILIVCSAGLYFYRHKTQPATTQIAKNDIAPGSNKAILTLAGGQKIILNDAKNGTLARQGGATINKIADGALAYAATQKDTAMAYNTLSTPRGGQHQLTLSDGTKVWLNAASSITYPVSFAGNERKVSVTGEAYFEVVHNAKMPFRVTVDGQTIEDIGTHFNINAYGDEPAVTTTLIEGAIKLSSSGASALLKPGQAASLNNNRYVVTAADINSAIAWKNGLFRFDDNPIQSLMRQLARWYDVEVSYEGTVTNHEFAGEIRRNTNLSNVLDILAQSGIHFRVEGRKLIVTP